MDFADVVMVFPPGGDVSKPNFDYHLGSSYIIAYLRKNGITAIQFVTNESLNVFECVKKIVSYKPKIIGFSVYLANYLQCALIAKELKRFDSNLIIVFGGPTPTFQSETIIEDNLNVDICVRGEGEEIFLDLINLLSENDYNLSNEILQNINGITYRGHESVVRNPDSNILLRNKSVKNYLDKYPSPILSEVIPATEAPRVGIITARGCNQNCIYCNCTMLSKRNIFTHSIDRVIDELAYLEECRQQKRIVWIWDDTFTLLPNRAKEICERIIDNQIRLKLSCITRADIITEDLLDLLGNAGIVEIGFGLESADPQILRKIGKVHPAEDDPSDNLQKEKDYIKKIRRMTAYARNLGIRTFVYVMQGLPGESIEDAQKTMNFVEELNLNYHVTQHLIIYPGTPLFSYYEIYGYQVQRGLKNKVYLKTNHPFNLHSIKIAPKSLFEKDGLDYDNKNWKVLAFNTKRDLKKNFFDNIILCSNSLKPTLIKWLQRNLAINGNFIHIYTDKRELIKKHDSNLFALHEYFSPTLQYHSYVRDTTNEYPFSLRPGRMLIHFNETFGFPMEIYNSEAALSSSNSPNPSRNRKGSIAIDFRKKDTQKLHEFLLKLSQSANFLDIEGSYPKFLHLCRWTGNLGNCLTFDTAIIGQDDRIRICWHGAPIGKVGMSFSELIQNFNALKHNTLEKRACNTCIKNETCIQCIFPHPLSSEEYCEYKKRYDTTDIAQFLKLNTR